MQDNSLIEHYLILVAGGVGKRFGSDIPKQFLDLKGKPIFIRSIEKFLEAIPKIKIVMVLPKSHFEMGCELKSKHLPQTPILMVESGNERFDSVKNGLNAISQYKENDLVAIHDAVRPMVSMETIQKAFEIAANKSSGVAFQKINASIRKRVDEKYLAVDRDLFFSVQTPQTFNLMKLKECYNTEYRKNFTDDASVFEEFGNIVHFFEGNPENIKITTPFDLVVANAYYS